MSFRQSCSTRIFGFLVFFGASAATSVADVIVSNLAEPLRASTPIGNNPNPVPPPDDGPWYWGAQSFVTDEVSYRLVSAEVMVGGGSTNPAPIVIAELWSDDQGTLGTLITTLTPPDVSGGISPQSMLPESPVTLEPNTAYWVLLGVQNPGEGTFFWSYANSNEDIGPGVLFWYGAAPDSGVTWLYGTDFPYFLQVNGTSSADEDDDGVDDVDDVCCGTPVGTLVDAYGRPIGDFDLDCDNDLVDYEFYLRGFTGPLAPQNCP